MTRHTNRERVTPHSESTSMRKATYTGPTNETLQKGATVYLVPPSRLPASLRRPGRGQAVVSPTPDLTTVSIVPVGFIKKERRR